MNSSGISIALLVTLCTLLIGISSKIISKRVTFLKILIIRKNQIIKTISGNRRPDVRKSNRVFAHCREETVL
jgi:hypothetical protein